MQRPDLVEATPALSLFPEMRVLEALPCVEGRLVHLTGALHQFKTGTDRVDHLLEIVTLNLKRAALQRTILRESGKYEMPSGF